MQLQTDFDDIPVTRVGAWRICLDSLTRFIPNTQDYTAEVPLDADQYEVAICYRGVDCDDGAVDEKNLALITQWAPVGLFDFELGRSPQTDVPVLYVSRK